MKDEKKTKECLTGELAELRQRVAELEAPGTTRQRAGQAISERRTWIPVVGTFILLCILIWLDEIADFHHLLLGAPRTPINWQEAALETFLIVVAGFFVVCNLVHVTRRKRAEEALWKSEQEYQTMIEQSNDMIWTLDTEGNLVFFNDRSEELTGHQFGDWQGQSFVPLIVEKDLPLVMDVFHRTLNGEPQHYEVRVRKHDGDVLVLSVNTAPILKAGQVVGTVSFGRDVTERVQAEESLRESEEQLRTLIDAMPDFVCFKDEEERWLEVNDASIQLFRLEGVDYRGKKDSELAELGDILRDTFLVCKETDAKAWKKRDPSHGEEMIPHPDGTVRVYDVIKVPIFHPDGERKGLVVLGHDITELKRVEAERERLLAQIQQQAQQMQQIVDTVPEGVLLLDADRQVILTNPLGQKDLAALADAKVGDTLTRLGDRPLAELLTSPPKGLWHEVATDSRSFEIIARPLETGPTPRGWVLVIRDVTREREIQRYSQQQERLAAVGQLAAGIAHDFNNIMSTIVLYAQMMSQREGLSARDQERLATINQQANHATRLIQQILDFSRRATLERRPLDLSPLLKEHVNLLERTLPESIQLDLVYGPDEYTVNADPTRVQQVLMNLSLNARDAMPEGGELCFGLERIRIQSGESPPLPEMEPGEWVQVMVSDTGTGILPDVLPHIFDPFFTTKTPGEGTGLGLAQVHGIVKQHKGEIDVQSPSITFIQSEPVLSEAEGAEGPRAGQVGQGTTFSIYLPALPVHPPEPLTLEPPALARGQGETILVVEDNQTTRKALVESLKLLNYRVLEATDGQEALDILERRGDDPSTGPSATLRASSGQGVALVLSDVVMPGMGGVALLQSLRQRGSTVKVVLTTGHPLEGELERLQAQGMSDWLPKPPSLEQLAQVLARVLNLC